MSGNKGNDGDQPAGQCECTTENDAILQSHFKEAEFLRAEALICIEHVRRLALYSTSIAGFAVPVLAALLELEDGSERIVTIQDFVNAMQEEYFVIQLVCLGVALSCLAFLRIYVGSFTQIFNFARYFREYLIPAINERVGSPEKEVFHWEIWLGINRRKRPFFVGDADLSAEPILIALYVFVYIGVFYFTSWCFDSFLWPSTIIVIIVLLLILQTFFQFNLVLKDASSKDRT